MNTTANTTATPYPARLACKRLQDLADNQSLELRIVWFWQGRERHGCLELVTKDRVVKFASPYSRATQVWGRGDETLDIVRTGSPKYHAVLLALGWLETQATRTAANKPANKPKAAAPAALPHIFVDRSYPVRAHRGRRPCGISDTLIDCMA